MKFSKVLKSTVSIISDHSKDIKKELNIFNCETFLDDPNNIFGKSISLFILGLVFISIGLMIFESVGNNSIVYANILFYLEAFISSVFALEYIYRLYVAKRKIKFILKWMSIIDLLSFLPFFLELFLSSFLNLTFLKILRLLKIFRIFKLVKSLTIVDPVFISIKDHRVEYEIGTILFGIMLLIASVFMYTIEGSVNPGLSTIPDAFWWSIVTMTTVGYGDVYPITVFGKIVGSFVIFLGPLFVAMLSSITVIIFMEVAAINRERKNIKKMYKICSRCKNKSNDKDANYCKICGEKLYH